MAETRTNPRVPLCVDLDGTLIKTDLLWESFVRVLRRNPLYLLAIPFWWARGRAFLKRRLAERMHLEAATLPFNEPFLAFLRQRKRAGQTLVLTTASDAALARAVAEQVGLFNEVLGSNGQENLRGRAKAKLLVARFGERGFDYAGNSSVDLAVWSQAREAIVVNAGNGLADEAAQRAKLGAVFKSPPRAGAFIQCLHPRRWFKNLIVFVPLLASHNPGKTDVLLSATWAFITFCVCASGVYILNDLADLDADRRDPAKQRRPFAAGDLPLPLGLVLAPILIACSEVAAFAISPAFAGMLGIYLLLAISYSWWMKQVVILDVVFITGLYLIRLIAGHLATRIEFSFWLLLFFTFVFLGLALVRRFMEPTRGH